MTTTEMQRYVRVSIDEAIRNGRHSVIEGIVRDAEEEDAGLRGILYDRGLSVEIYYAIEKFEPLERIKEIMSRLRSGRKIQIWGFYDSFTESFLAERIEERREEKNKKLKNS